jgi:hypothetical protein
LENYSENKQAEKVYKCGNFRVNEVWGLLSEKN